METNFELFGSNWIYEIITLATLTFLLHMPLFFKYNLSKKSWKRVDYLWIGLTALGLIGSIPASLHRHGREIARGNTDQQKAGAVQMVWNPHS